MDENVYRDLTKINSYICLVFFKIKIFEILQHISKNLKSIYIRVLFKFKNAYLNPLNVVRLNLTFFVFHGSSRFKFGLIFFLNRIEL